MVRGNIFFRYQENAIIQNIIKNYGEKNDTIQKKTEKYMTTKAYQFIKSHNPHLDFKSYQIYTMPYLPNYLFAIVLTKTNMNHPYLMYLNLVDRYITFLIPFGKDRYQADMNDYYDAIDTLTTLPELTAIYILAEKTIIIRKKGIITSDQFSLISCNNISNCVRRYHEIDKMSRVSNKEKQELKKKAAEFYTNKAIEFLQNYFAMLDHREFDNAWEFLKGDSGEYYGKQRLNTFFRNTKSIIGHLEIFVYLYELFFEVRDKIFISR